MAGGGRIYVAADLINGRSELSIGFHIHGSSKMPKPVPESINADSPIGVLNRRRGNANAPGIFSEHPEIFNVR